MTSLLGAVAIALPLLLWPGDARADQASLAVVDLWGDPTVGLVPPKPEEVQAVTEQLRGELAATGRWALVPAGDVARALAERGVAPRDCSRDCLVAVGRAVAAARVVSGRVVRMMTLLWGLDLQVTDVATGAQLGSVGEFKGDYLALKTLGIRRLVREIAAAPAGAAEPSAADVRARLAAATEDRPADLSGLNLAGLDLSRLDFKRAKMRGANLEGANLAGANLFAVDLAEARLAGADLSGATLNVAVLRGAKLAGARLVGASLFAVIATGADFSRADLSGARIIAEMSNANLSGANLSKANLGADRGNQPMGLMRAVLHGADLSGANLSGANLSKAELPRANLAGANLAGASLALADLSGADLAGADLRGARGLDEARGLTSARNVDRAIRE
jgi:uncharacterized protein YjbI with pentapeptide repeats